MYRPSFPHLTISQMDVQMNSKTVTPGHGSPLPVGSPVCEDGNPYVTDPLTGRKICICNLGVETTRSLMSDARKQGMSLSGPVASLAMGMETSAFYSPLIRGVPVRQDRLPSYMTASTPGQPMTFDSALDAHPYGFLYAGVDLNGVPIRKAATRETTGPLKVWLSEHKKNPYPTKAEKIMLAIITRMTLTQVSTWFANARRRLKKENKLFPADRDNRDDDSDEDFNDSQREGNTSQSAGSEKRTLSESDTEDINVDLSDFSDNEDGATPSSSGSTQGQGRLSVSLHGNHLDLASSEIGYSNHSTHNNEYNQPKPDKISHSAGLPVASCGTRSPPPTAGFGRPKIWSISEIIYGPSTVTNSHEGHTGAAPLTSETSPSLAITKQLHSSSPKPSFRQTCTTQSVAMISPSSTYSLSQSLSSSPTSSTFLSMMGVPSVLLHSPELPGFVSRYRVPATTNTLYHDRCSTSATVRSPTENTSHGRHSRETITGSNISKQNSKEDISGLILNKLTEGTIVKERAKYYSDTSPSPTPSASFSSTHPKTTSFTSTAQKAYISSSKSRSEHHDHLRHRNGDLLNRQTPGSPAHS